MTDKQEEIKRMTNRESEIDNISKEQKGIIRASNFDLEFVTGDTTPRNHFPYLGRETNIIEKD